MAVIIRHFKWGIHLETTEDSAQAIIEHCADELVPAPYVQAEGEILTADLQKYQNINQLMNSVLDYLDNAQQQ